MSGMRTLIRSLRKYGGDNHVKITAFVFIENKEDEQKIIDAYQSRQCVDLIIGEQRHCPSFITPYSQCVKCANQRGRDENAEIDYCANCNGVNNFKENE